VGHRLRVLIGTGALAAGVAVPAVVVPAAAEAATTPVVSASVAGWSHLSVRPAWIYIGEGGSPVAHVGHWSTWDRGEPSPHATAHGTLWTNNCLPNCAQGHQSPHRLLITLSVVKTHRGVRYYSRMSWSTPGYRLPGAHSSTVVLHFGSSGAPFWG
jgi:hypothetical protein